MSCKVRFYLILIVGLFFLFFSEEQLHAQKREFVLVIDPGHGGHDPGAVGRRSKEKDIVLAVSKKFAALVEKNMPDVKIVYTRKTDVFIPLQQRATIANNNKADLFVSIHVNAAKNKSAYGAETYTLGLAKTQANLDVAMKENAVILLEDDYQTTYKGFDPKSIDSYIMFEFMMDTYLDNSIAFATHVQNNFVRAAKRYDRGVKQAGFWVLHRTASPSVLIELGFISNYNEELYLISTSGQQELAQSIYDAFVKYKRNYDLTSGYNYTDTATQSTTIKKEGESADRLIQEVFSQTEPSFETLSKDKPIFKLQIFASLHTLKLDDPNLRGLNDVSFYQEGKYYKYTVGSDNDLNKINDIRLNLKNRFPDAFIVAFYQGKKIDIQEAKRMIKK